MGRNGIKPDLTKVPAGEADEVVERGALPQGEPDPTAAFWR
jgi:hypothetical protein